MKIIDILIAAKEYYLCNTEESDDRNMGMCHALKVIIVRVCEPKRHLLYYRDLFGNIPEFNGEFLGSDLTLPTGVDFWWLNTLTEPRIKAFDTLISIYSDEEHKDLEYDTDK